jgi:hypothetical protein
MGTPSAGLTDSTVVVKVMGENLLAGFWEETIWEEVACVVRMD